MTVTSTPAEPVPLTRADLYDRVWAEPVHSLAARYGISDVGLAKICRKLSIPVPGRGYWQKLLAGVRVKRPVLPPLKGARAEAEIVVLEARLASAPSPPRPPAVEAQLVIERAPEHQIVVPLVLPPARELHSLVRHLVAPSRRGTSTRESEYRLDFRVSAAAMDRAVRIMDTLFKALDARGYLVECRHPRPRPTSRGGFEPVTWWPSQHPGYVTCVAVGEQDVLLTLRELEMRVSTTPEQPVRPARRATPGHEPRASASTAVELTEGRTRYELAPSGRLSVFIPHHVGGWGQFRTWSDGRGERGPRLEDQLNQVIVGIVEAAEEYRRVAARWRKAEEERRQAELRRAELERLRAQEAARSNELERQATAWSLARTIREYAAAARALGPETAKRVAPRDMGGEDWLRWAEMYADRLDPLVVTMEAVAGRNEV